MKTGHSGLDPCHSGLDPESLLIWEYAKSLPYVTQIGLLGHSQGGVIASMTAGREYLLTTQQLDIYGTAAAYQGPVLLLHGTKDSIVPMWCSEQYLETYGSHATLVKVDGENHLITRRKKEILSRTVAILPNEFDKDPKRVKEQIKKSKSILKERKKEARRRQKDEKQ